MAKKKLIKQDVKYLIVRASHNTPEDIVNVKKMTNKVNPVMTHYHFVIDRRGIIYPWCPLDEPALHTQHFNLSSISVLLIGGKEHVKGKRYRNFCNFTLEQYEALDAVWDEVKQEYPGIEPTSFYSIWGTGEPYFDVKQLLGG